MREHVYVLNIGSAVPLNLIKKSQTDNPRRSDQKTILQMNVFDAISITRLIKSACLQFWYLDPVISPIYKPARDRPDSLVMIKSACLVKMNS